MKFKEKQNFFRSKKIFFVFLFLFSFSFNFAPIEAATTDESYAGKAEVNLVPADQVAKAGQVDDGTDGSCGITGDSSLWNCVEQIEYGIMGIISWLMGVCVGLFNQVLLFTVLDLTNTINTLDVINIIWGTLRDVANMALIFVILFIAINTIIGRNDHGIKEALSKVIFVAVLINFSMFFGKVVIDTGNILCLQIYQKITQNTDENKDLGVSDVLMNSFNFQQLYGSPTREEVANLANQEMKEKYQSLLIPVYGPIKFVYMTIFPSTNLEARAFAKNPNASTLFFMGSITMFIVACVFLSASVIFIKRMITIILLLTSSSIAFAGSITHKTEGMSHQWWEKLIKEAFYAPIFMGVMWIAILVMRHPAFLNSVSSRANTLFGIFAAGTIVSYIFVINLFILALTLGEKIGVSGSQGAMKTFGWLKTNLGARPLQSFAVRPVGNWAYKHLEGKDGKHKVNDVITRWKTGKHGAFKRVLGDIGSSALHGLADAKLAGGAAGKSSIEQGKAIEEAIAVREFEIKSDSKAVADLYVEMSVHGREKNDLDSTRGFERRVEGKSSKELANMIAVMQDTAKKSKEKANTTTNQKEKAELLKIAKQNEDTVAHIMRRLDDTKVDEVEKAGEKELPYHRDKFNDLLEGEKDPHSGNRAGGIKESADYKELYDPSSQLNKDIKKLSEDLEEMKKRGVSETDTVFIKTKTDLETKKKDFEDKEKNFLALPKVQELRNYVSSLNSVQHAGLNPKQIISPIVVDMIKGKMISQLDSGGRLNSDELVLMNRRAVTPRVKRLVDYTKAIKENDDEARQRILLTVNEHLTSKGKTIIQTGDNKKDTELAFDIYERELMPDDSSAAASERNLSRSVGTDFGGDGEKINKNASEARADRHGNNNAPSANPQNPGPGTSPQNPGPGTSPQNQNPVTNPAYPPGYAQNPGGSLIIPTP